MGERRLISLLSTAGKTKEQLATEAVEAIARWREAHQQSSPDSD